MNIMEDSMEFLMTYGWVILTLAIVVVSLYALSTINWIHITVTNSSHIFNYTHYFNSNGRTYQIINYHQNGFFGAPINCTYTIYQINQTTGKVLLITNKTLTKAILNLSQVFC